jgi:diguanylate cyclase (GGDEF)-like protein/PAS domain S-box-containing protein
MSAARLRWRRKKKAGTAHRDALPYAALHAAFAAVALLFLSGFVVTTGQLRRQLTEHFAYMATSTGDQVAGAVSQQIFMHFGALKFLRGAFFADGSGRLVPDAAARAAIGAYQRSHPDIFAINIQDPTGNAIVWSSRRQSPRPVTTGQDFTPLPGHPNELLGQASYASRAKGWVVTMRQRILADDGRVLGYIGSPFLLSSLRDVTTPPGDLVSLNDARGRIISVWRHGRWAPPGGSLPPMAGSASRPVPGLPWSVRVGWTAGRFDAALLARQQPWAMFLGIVLLFVLASDLMVVRLYGRAVRLRHYQAAVVRIGRDLMTLPQGADIFQRIVEAVVEETGACGAFVAVPNDRDSGLQPIAAAADREDLRTAMLALRPSSDPDRRPEGAMAAGIAFREGRPVGPFNPRRNAATRRIQAANSALRRVRAVMAYPIFITGESRAHAILVVADTAAGHFSDAVHGLLEQLSLSVGTALTDLLRRRTIDRELSFSEKLFNSIGAMALVIDGNGEIERMNDAAEHFTGYDLDAVRGQPYFWRRFIPDDEHPRVQGVFRALGDHSIPHDVENHWISRSGEKRLFHWVNTILDDGDGRPGHLITVGMDVTDQRKMEAALTDSAHRLQRLSDFNALLRRVSQEIAAATDETALLRAICDLTVHYAHVELAAVGRPDADGWFSFPAAAGRTSYLEEIKVSTDAGRAEGCGAIGTAWRKGSPAYNQQVADHPGMGPWLARFRSYGFRSNAALPVFRNGTPWGVFSLYYSEADVFDADLRSLLEELAADISRGFDRIESRSLQNALFNGSSVMVVLVKDRVIQQVNTRGAEMLGYTAAELSGRPARDLYADDEGWRRVGGAYQDIDIIGEARVTSVPMRHKDGSVRIGDLSGVAMTGRDGWTVWTIDDVTERHLLGEELSRQAMFDRLTGLPNRRALDDALDKAVARAGRSGRPLAVVMMDLDGFKPVNDTHGHEAGDVVLRVVGRRLRDTLRRTDFIARFGGDEFVLLVEDCAGPDEIADVLDKVEAAIVAPIPVSETLTVQVGVSAGLCLYPTSDTDGPEALLRYADQALYASKASKADRPRFWVNCDVTRRTASRD